MECKIVINVSYQETLNSITKKQIFFKIFYVINITKINKLANS